MTVQQCNNPFAEISTAKQPRNPESEGLRPSARIWQRVGSAEELEVVTGLVWGVYQNMEEGFQEFPDFPEQV